MWVHYHDWIECESVDQFFKEENWCTQWKTLIARLQTGADAGVEPNPPWDDRWLCNITGIPQKKKIMWFIGVTPFLCIAPHPPTPCQVKSSPLPCQQAKQQTQPSCGTGRNQTEPLWWAMSTLTTVPSLHPFHVWKEDPFIKSFQSLIVMNSDYLQHQGCDLWIDIPSQAHDLCNL